MKTAVILIVAFVIARIILNKTDKNPPQNVGHPNHKDNAKSEHAYKSQANTQPYRSAMSPARTSKQTQYDSDSDLGPVPTELYINGVVYRDPGVIKAIMVYIQHGRVLSGLPDEIMFVADAQLDEAMQNSASVAQRSGWSSDYAKPSQPSPSHKNIKSRNYATESKNRNSSRPAEVKSANSSSFEQNETHYQSQYQSQYKSQFSDRNDNE
ncbi:hypothetical protein [Celerinatantimonas sp. MCCC 1A17872]|uniref:hypothetical protein n=1 Tax=Celerinatantimonas sp. MCCC 1A17872 TaxID=3177514 RepID=UPI0038CBEF9B